MQHFWNGTFGLPTGVVFTIRSLLFNIAASRLPGYRCILIGFSICFPMIAALCLWQVPEGNNANLLGAYYAFYSYWAPYTMSIPLSMANTSSHIKLKIPHSMLYSSSATLPATSWSPGLQTRGLAKVPQRLHRTSGQSYCPVPLRSRCMDWFANWKIGDATSFMEEDEDLCHGPRRTSGTRRSQTKPTRKNRISVILTD